MIASPPLIETASCLCWAARRSARAITRRFDRALRPYGLRATQFSLLALLELKGAQSMTELADSVGADRTTLTRNLALMEAQGLVEIQPGEDARARLVAIARAGKRALTEAFETWRATQDEITRRIGGPAADSLRQTARALRAA